MTDRNMHATLMSPMRRQLLAAVGASSLCGGSLMAQTTGLSLKCAGAYTDALFHTQNLQQFAREVLRQSQGAVQIEVVSNSKSMPMEDVLPALSKGDLAIGEIFMSNFAQQYPLLAIDSLPFVVRSFDDARHLWEVTRQPTEKLLQKQGVRLLYAAPWPGQGLFARTPVNRLEDVKGMKFRVNNNATKYIAQVCGATPVDIAANNLFKAIQSGQVDVMLTSSTTGVDSQAWNAMGVFVDIRAWIPKNIICISEKYWAKLPEASKTVIKAAAKQAESRAWKMAMQADSAAQKILTSQGVKISAPSFELRRALDLIGEKFARDWSSKVGVDGVSALISYYVPQPKEAI